MWVRGLVFSFYCWVFCGRVSGFESVIIFGIFSFFG